MPRAVKKTEKVIELQVVDLEQHEGTFYLTGITPFICNRVAEKAKRELLFPRGTLTKAQKQSHLKHDPPQEFRDSPYVRRGPGPTRILMKATAIKGAIGQAAIDMPTDVARAQVDRLTYVVEEYVPIWGIPYLNMDVVRNSDIGHTSDIRTRAKLLQWATKVTIRYTVPMLTPDSIFTLLAASGKICGIGDFRQQKGKGSNGLYSVSTKPTPEWERIVAAGGMKEQDQALADIVASDPESEDLFNWWLEEVKRRRPTKETATEAEVVAGEATAKPRARRKTRTNGPSTTLQ